MQFPEQLSGFYQRKYIVEDSLEVREKKKLAVEEAVEELWSEMVDQIRQLPDQDMNESDSEDSYMRDVVPTNRAASVTDATSNLPYTRDNIEKFIDSLRFNLLFNLGFEVRGINPNDEDCCICPCSMKKWRENFGLEFMNDIDKDCNYNGTPSGLFQHVTDIGSKGGYLHQGIAKYLWSYYKNFWGNVGHKALYRGNDAQYRLAEAEQKKKEYK